MLIHSFIHTPGVGFITERRIWEEGIITWQQFLSQPGAAKLPPRQTNALEHHLQDSLERLRERDYLFFAHYLPRQEHWRVYPEFAEQTAYLDIETTGLGEFDVVTVIGLHDGITTKTFIRGINLLDFAQEVKKFGILVTFYGSVFDLPILRREFGELQQGRIHLDLCFLLKRLGYRGGLKNIERQLGIERSEDTAGLSGWDAVRLWQEYKTGSKEALSLLLQYNAEDVGNLPPLLDFACQKLRELRWRGINLQHNPSKS